MAPSKGPAVFRGRFHLKLDPKSRLSLPAAFRSILEDNDRMIITNSQQQGRRCLDVYPEKEWVKLEKKISRLPQFKAEVQAFQRFYLSGGHPISTDSQSRILVPPHLKLYAGLQANVVVVGFSRKFEIWAEDAWISLFETLASGFDQTLNGISELVGSPENDDS